jgi:hypothetical protein
LRAQPTALPSGLEAWGFAWLHYLLSAKRGDEAFGLIPPFGLNLILLFAPRKLFAPGMDIAKLCESWYNIVQLKG